MPKALKEGKGTICAGPLTDDELVGLGLKCGLEIHQQLDTTRLFSRMPATIVEGKPDYEVVRYLRASAGETGEIDAAVAQERVKAKRFRYQGYHGITGLVELDEEPPAPMNEEALLVALKTAKLVGASILDTIHVMRKTVIDGSNTTGFQRTSLIAFGGKLLEHDVRVQTLCLEEDSCKIVTRGVKEDVYNLSRLGVPLIELATEPDITTPEMAKEVAAEIGMLLRSTGKCKRGLGTIRQDLNVSIKQGARVEIKGAQDLKLLPELVRREMRRQAGLLAIRDELARRQVSEILLPAPKDVSRLFADSALGFITKGLKAGHSLVGISLPKFEGLLGTELCTNYRLGTELAGYAKTMGFGGIIHSDEQLSTYKFTSTAVASARRALGAKKGDAILMVLGDKEKVEDFYAFVLIPRLEKLLHGVPEEVRRAEPDGSTTYLRPMPGAARMYPETDIPHIHIDAADVKAPKTLKEQEAALVKKFRITQAHAKGLLREGWPFDEYVQEFGKLSPVFIATTLLDTPKELKKRYSKELDLFEKEQELKEILARVNERSVPKEALIQLLALIADGKKPDFSKFKAVDEKEIEKVIIAVIKEDPKAPISALMGQAMKRLRGKAPGNKVMALLRKHI